MTNMQDLPPEPRVERPIRIGQIWEERDPGSAGRKLRVVGLTETPAPWIRFFPTAKLQSPTGVGRLVVMQNLTANVQITAGREAWADVSIGHVSGEVSGQSSVHLGRAASQSVRSSGMSSVRVDAPEPQRQRPPSGGWDF